jgi:predicted Zn-dependent protease
MPDSVVIVLMKCLPRRRLDSGKGRAVALAAFTSGGRFAVAIAWMTFALLTGGLLAAPSLISVQEEIALGRESQRQVRTRVPTLADRTVTAYIDSVGRRLASHAQGPRYPYSFSVANYREVNAFALPGGPVWIHRGAIALAQNEAQLAGVLGHEIAHIAERHAADQITKGLVANGLLGLLGALLGNDTGARAAQMAAQTLAGGYMLKFSRDDEREADRVGARIMRDAGWDAREMIAFMELLRREQGRAAAHSAAGRDRRPPRQRAVSAGARPSEDASAGAVDEQALTTLCGVNRVARCT